MNDTRSFSRQTAELFEVGRWPLAVLLAACVARLWLVPLSSSFWVDELVTVFVVKHPGDASFAVAPQVPQSIYYCLPRISGSLFGISEISYRAPSMLAMAIALWLTARLAARLIHPRAGWFAVFAALSIRGIDYFAIDARPYALGMTMAAASLYFLVQWLDSARWPDAALLVLCAAVVWRVHLLYWPFYPLIAIYAAMRLASGDTRVRWPQWAAAGAAIAISLLPQALNALALAHAAFAHVIAIPPTLHVFEHELHWNLPLLCGAAAWLLSILPTKSGRWPKPPRQLTGSALFLILGWWLLHPLCLFLYSRLSGNSVYIGRYLSLMLPGVALTATAAASWWVPANRWRLAAGLMAMAAFLAQGHWDTAWFRHDTSDWRGAARELNRFASDLSTPVIVPSAFIEARPPAWTPDYRLPGFLYAQLDGYPIMGKPFLFPFDSPRDTPDGVRYAEELVHSRQLTSGGKWAIYGPERHVRDWQEWFSRQPEFAGWRDTLQEFGDVYVAEFRRK